MKCFLLELHVIWQEVNNTHVRDTVDNLIILANSSLSSNRVSYPALVQSQRALLGLAGESCAGCNGQAGSPEGEGVRSGAVASGSGGVTSVHTVLSCSLLIQPANSYCMTSVSAFSCQSASGQPVRSPTSTCLSPGAQIDTNLITSLSVQRGQ